MINLYQLQLFLAVVDRGTFSGAAAELHLTQPAISLQVRALEDRVGVRLFNRQGQRLELTDAGHALIEPARRLLTLAQEVEEGFSAGQGQLRGRLNLVYSHSSVNALYLLPTMLAEFRRQAQAVQFSLQTIGEETALSMLLDFQTHFAILSNEPRQKSIEAFLLDSDKLVLAIPKAHSWNGKTINSNDLRDQAFVLGCVGSEARRLSDLVLRSVGISLSEVEIVGETDTVQASAELVRAGLGFTFLHERMARNLTDLGIAYLQLRLEDSGNNTTFDRETWLARYQPSADNPPSPAQSQFWEFVCKNPHILSAQKL